MNSKIFRQSLVLVSSLAFAASLSAQAPAPKLDLPAPSPASTLAQRVGLTDIEIVYSRPGVKGRKIFGGLEPWGEVWRAGANTATKVSFSTPVKFGGTDVPAGSYALYAKLGENEWTVILSKVVGQWGAYRYDPKNDVARIAVKPAKLAELVETFTIDINDIRDDSATLNLTWEKTRVSVKIENDVVATLVPQIDAFMSSDAAKKPYMPAAMFYLDHNLDLNKASAWMDAAIAEQPTAAYLIYRKAKVLAAMGDKAGALATAQKSKELASKDTSPAGAEYVHLNEMLIAGLK